MLRPSVLSTITKPLKNPSLTNGEAIFSEYFKNTVKVTLNRPKALNAITLDMIHFLRSELSKWNENSDSRVLTFHWLNSIFFRPLSLPELAKKLSVLVEILEVSMMQS